MQTGSKTVYAREEKIDNFSLFRKEKTALLSHLDMELTERCNNNCRHCCINLPADDACAKEKELATDEIREILKEAVTLGCLTARFTGGEPFLREDFEELYIFARKIGLRVLIFTNATLINQHWIDLFSRIPPLEKIEVSVYGMKKNSYEAVSRVAGSYEACWRGINLFLEHKIPFVVKSALFPHNKEERKEFEAWAATLPWMEGMPPSYAMFFDLRCRRDDAQKSARIKKLRPIPREGVKFLVRRQAEYLKEMKEFFAKFMRPAGNELFSCGSGINGGCVDAYGYFQPCLMLRHPDCIYDLRKGSLKDALENFFPKLREAKATNLGYLARCGRCFLKGLCEQCPGKSWMEHGTLDTPVEYFCEVAHAQAKFLGLLKGSESSWEIEDGKERVMEFSGKRRALYA